MKEGTVRGAGTVLAGLLLLSLPDSAPPPLRGGIANRLDVQVQIPAPAISSSIPLVLLHGTMIDGSGAPPVRDAAVIVRGRTIEYAGPRAGASVPDQARRVDVQGGFILPGFINAHVHDAFSADRLAAWAAAGVTTVRDEGLLFRGGSLAEFIARRDREWSGPAHARLISAGRMICPPYGYGWLWVTSPEDARRKVEQEVAEGADQIKLAMERGYRGTAVPVLPLAEVLAIVESARASGRRVSGHVTQSRYLQDIVEAGVDDAAHMPGDPVPDFVFDRMIAREMIMVPTLTVLEAYGALAGARSNLARFVARGGRVAMGNDYTAIPQNGFDHFELGMPMHEIRRMAEAGMTPLQIIVASTRNAALVCGLEGETGVLQAGMEADILVVRGDPLADLNALARPGLVVHRGRADGVLLPRDGDLNGDGAVNGADYRLLALFVTENAVSFPLGAGWADLTGDGRLDVADLLLLAGLTGGPADGITVLADRPGTDRSRRR